MKNQLLIKLSDIIIDTRSCRCKAAKKSVEFFLGRMVSDEEISELKENPSEYASCIEKFLSIQGSYIREAAINKKFNEYFFGKEFSGLIKEAELAIDKKSLSKIEQMTILSMMPQEATEFVKKRLGIKSEAICCESVSEGLEKAKKKLTKFTYVGNEIKDYEAAAEKNIPFIGLGMKEDIKGEKINKIEELLL